MELVQNIQLKIKQLLAIAACIMFCQNLFAQSIVTAKEFSTTFRLSGTVIYVDSNDFALVKKSAELLQKDIEAVTGIKTPIVTTIPKTYNTLIAIGTLTNSAYIKDLAAGKKSNLKNIAGKWEAYQLEAINRTTKGASQHIISIAGSDRRGTAYGVLEFSKQLGVSPWYWWADVPIQKKANVFINTGVVITDSPRVKYRGIFINDEAPALSTWSKNTFGGFNHLFYEKTFELLLRLKANYIWPAMWGNAFYYDDSLNIKTADDYGIVIGTSHHEPLMRAHEEWKYFGKGKKWDYDSTEKDLKEFWRGGMQRATNEKIVSVGMRGDGDAPMSRETATSLLERIVTDQREIIANVTGKPANQTPQLWALYKEVQDYYDKGMRVPDDVTLLLCDDNWGNIRRLPNLNDKPRSGGYGIYYHFDYVGGPRNYKWINTNPLPRVWEQMHLAWEYNVKNIWIVNVGDIKPMELPTSFFLDYAWNPDRIGADDIKNYTEKWSADQFGSKYAQQIAVLLSQYAKYNGRRKPELLDANTFNLAKGEFQEVVNDYQALLKNASSISNLLTDQYKDAFFQLVLFPIKASANLYELYFYAAKNKTAFGKHDYNANIYADKVNELFLNDSLITLQYHQIHNGKWNNMMSQTHIGYTYWQQPNQQKMPAIWRVPDNSLLEKQITNDTADVSSRNMVAGSLKRNYFYELNGIVSIEADHFTTALNGKNIKWKILPDHGKMGSALTTFPVTASLYNLESNSPHVEYEFYSYSRDSLQLYTYFSPTLNIHNSATGLQFAVSIDNEQPQVISLNKDDYNTRRWEGWVANNIIIKSSPHFIDKPGKHILKYWMLDGGVVLQKLVIDFGNMPYTYLGPDETRAN